MPRTSDRFGRVLRLSAALTLAATPSLLRAFALESSSWPKGTASSPTQVQMQLHMQVGPPAFPSSPLQDGSTSWNQVVQAAMADWNQYLTTLQFSSVSPSALPIPTSASTTNHNDVFWSSSIYGDSWGSGGDTLGITIIWYGGSNNTVETDILFNNTGGINWDSYRGNLQFSPIDKTDLRRIALHELGHVLGLDHPDQATPPQTVAAIMNSAESNTDDLTADDIAGGRYLYGLGPVITAQPASQTIAQNSSVNLSVTASSSSTITYQWQKNGVNVSGATGSSLVIASVQLTDAGSYTVLLTNSLGTTTSNAAVLTVTQAPSFTQTPASSVTVSSGRTAVFSVAATGTPTPTYQWNFNATPISTSANSSATDPILLISSAVSANAGNYTCTIANSTGAVTSSAGALSVITTAPPAYLVALSARANIGTGNNILIGGVTLRGSGTKQLILRGVGPALGASPAVITNPVLTMEDINGLAIATNTGWGNAPVVGASPISVNPQMATSTEQINNIGSTLANGSADSAMLVTAPVSQQADYTIEVSGVAGGTGIGLVEIYNADVGTPTGRINSLSARAFVGTGNNILIGGFSIRGTGSETVLVRGIGPALGSTALTQPVLAIFDGNGVQLYSNTGWGGDTTIQNVTINTAGPPGLPSASRDSVLLLTLPAGPSANYTAQVSGLSSTTGIALVEIYEVF